MKLEDINLHEVRIGFGRHYEAAKKLLGSRVGWNRDGWKGEGILVGASDSSWLVYCLPEDRAEPRFPGDNGPGIGHAGTGVRCNLGEPKPDLNGHWWVRPGRIWSIKPLSPVQGTLWKEEEMEAWKTRSSSK